MRREWSTPVGPTLAKCVDIFHVYSDTWACLLHKQEQGTGKQTVGTGRQAVCTGYFQIHVLCQLLSHFTHLEQPLSSPPQDGSLRKVSWKRKVRNKKIQGWVEKEGKVRRRSSRGGEVRMS